MGAWKDRIKGTGNIGAGRIKQGLARDLGDPGMSAGGTGQEFKGQSQRFMGGIKATLGNALHRFGSKVRRS